tara:strand:- start:434 stop:1588 length:1155 start_codon:yes stop_codon:yes gene_type:complete
MAQVGNKNIDNASGQVVRLDIQNTLAAVATNNFGARNSGGTILPCEFLADDTTNKLLIRKSSGGDQANPNPSSGTAAVFFEVGNLDEDNLGLMKKSGAAMTGQLLADDGSGAASPAYAFDTDTDTGMFRSGANTIGFSTSGTTRVSISDAGLDVVNGLPIRLQDSSGAPFVSLKSPSSLSGNVALTLPSSITNGGFLQTDGSGNLSFQIVAGVPTGAVFCVAVATIPTGYLECNGAAVSRTTYAALFSFVGTQYGAGNGSSTFNLPDLRGEFVRGFDNGKGVDSGRSIGSNQTGQNLSHDHDADASATSNVSDPGHRHNARGFGNDDDGGNQFTGSGNNDVRNNAIEDATTGISVATNVSIDVDNDGGNEARPRNVAMMYIIKV